MFNKPAALTTYLADNPTVKVKITDEAGVLSIPDDGKVDLKSRDFIANTHTIVYTLENACGQKLLEAKNSLTVNSQIDISTDSNVNLCSPNPTYNEVTQYIKERNHTVRALLATFDWYTSLADAKAKTNKQTGTASIGNISETMPKTLYLRYSKIGFCDSDVMTITVKKVATTAPAVKSLGTVCAVTVEALKKLIDPTDFANVIIYHNDNVLVNDYSLTNDSQIYYAKKVGACQTAKAKVNFTLQAVTQAAPQSLSLCATTNQYGNLIVSNERVKKALKAIYPTIPTNEIKLYKKQESQESFNEYTETLILVNQVLYFTIKEVNKCTSPYYRLLLSTTLSQTTASPVVASLCSDATVADLRATIGGAHTINIYKENAVQTDAMPIDWDKINNYTYTILEAGGCESLKASITLTKSNNTTSIIPKGVNLCGGVAQTIATIKAQLGDSSAKVYLKNGNNYDEQADNATVNTTLTYYYTVKAAGKCISEKAPIAITIAQPTPTPQGPNSTTGCIKTVGDLRSYIRAQDPTRNTDALAIYAGLLDTNKGLPLADATVLTQTTYSYAYTAAGKCESAIRHITITPNSAGNETLNLQGSNNSLSCIPTGQLRFQIQRAQAGRTYVVVLTEVPATYTGTRTFTVTETDKDGTTPFVKFTGYNMPDGAYKARLITCNTANANPVPATVNRMPRDFPAPDRSNNDFGTDQAYRDIQSGGKPDCGYMDIRYSNNTNSPFYRYFNTPELAALYEYTAYSDDDLANKYGGNRSHSDIVWRDLFSLPTGKTSVIQNVLYYDLAYHNRTYKDLKEEAKKPKFYFRIKGQNCSSASPMLIGANGMSFMNTGIVFGGTCQNPEMSVTAENQMVCYPVKYVINENGTKVAEGEITYATERKNVTTLASGQTFKRNQRYQVVFTSQDGQVQTQTDSFDDFYNAMRPGGEYKEQARCFGSNEAPKGNIQVFHRVNQSGTIFSMNGFKVTLLEAPTGYTNEPGKLRLNETVTIQYTDPTKRATNIMATERQDDMTQMFSLPEGTYKIRVEDPCGKVTYLYSGRDATKQEFDLNYVPYQEKALTPKVETECTKVRVYPFKNNPASDWLKINNQNKNIYVYLFKRPTGITDGDIAVSSNLSEVIGGTRYVKAVFKPNEANSDDQYFSLPRNQNSEGSYTFIYGAKIGAVGREEQELINYISSNGTNGCVRTFTISVDDVLLNFDRNGYIGYKCEDNTGKIVIKAINGISGTGTYKYELYDRKDGTRIDTQTAAKGSTVTFTNLGTFSAGQNTRWVKIIDSECPTDPVWKELPITPLDNPELVLASPLQSGYCKGSTVTITLRSLGAPSYQWKYPDGTTTVTTLPQLVIPSIDAQHAGIYQVVAQGLVCAANTVTFSYTVNILEAPATGKTYTLCAAATITDLKAKIATDTATVRVYKNGTLVTDNTESLSTTDTYKVSRFNAVCETDKVVVTIVFSNTVTFTVPSALTVTCTATNIDTVVSNWLNQATVTDTCGTATLTHNFTAVKPTNWCGAGVVTVTFVGKDPQGNTVTKTSVIKVNSVPIVAKDDTYTVTNGLTGGTTPSVLTNDSLNGNNNPSTSSVTLTWLTVPSGLQTNTDGTVRVPAGTASGTYTVTYRICEKLNSSNCDTATLTITVLTPVTPTTIEANDDVATVSSTTGGTTSSVLTNDKLNGVPNPSVSSVTLTWNTATPTGFTLNPNGTITIAPNTPAGTYTISYKICAVASSTVCDTANIVVTVTGTTTSTTTPTTIEANDDGVTTITSTTGGTTPSVLTNDKLNGVPNPSISSITLTWNTATPTGFTLNPNGTITIAPNTPAGTYTISYKICAVASPTVCDTANIVVTVTGTTTSTTTPTTIEANDDGVTTITSTTGGTTLSVLTNDKLNGVPNPSVSSVTLTWTTATPTGFTLNPNGTIRIAPNTPAGTYTISYKICAVVTSTVCDNANIVVTVTGTTTSTTTPTTIEANDDGVTTITSTTGGTTSSVLTNDKLNGIPNPSVSSVTLTWNTATPTGFTLNPNGTITVAPNTPAGTYTISYKICAVASPTVCDTANIVVTVTGTTTSTTTPTTIEANDDVATVSSTTGGTTSSVLTNDKLNGIPNPSVSSVTLTWTTATPTGFTLNPNGTITVAPNTPAGTYTISYKICAVASSTVCDNANIVVTVTGTTTSTTPVLPVAADDRTTTPIDTPVVVNVLANDTPNGATPPNVVTNPTNGTTVVNPDGTIEYRPHTGFEGIDTFVYELCNTDGCASATVTIEVISKLIPYNGMSVDDDGKNEHFHIGGINRYPDNVVRIYNRWGVKVFETEGYDNATRVFRGFSNGRVVVETSDKLPQGTYYYVIEYVDENRQKRSEVGWLYLKR